MKDLTIIMPTFNKEKYIRKALDSIFEQITTYSFEILISDDFSTVRTLDIVMEYKNKNIIDIKILKSESNQGLYHNIMKAYAELGNSKYFTVLDPDDYWCDKNKIQISIDYLEKHEDFTIYSSNIYIEKNKEHFKYFSQKREKNFSYIDFLNGTALIGQTSGTFFRNVVFNNGIPPEILKFNQSSKYQTFRGDSFRNFIHIQKGNCHYDPVCRSVYVITEDGIWTSTSEIKQDLVNITVNKDLFLYSGAKDFEILQKAYDSYKVYLKRLPSLILKNNFTNSDDINYIFSELMKLQMFFNDYASNIELEKQHKKKINNIVIKILKRLYKRGIVYLE